VKLKPIIWMVCAVFLILVRWNDANGGDIVEPTKVRALAQPLIEGGWANGLVIGLITDRGTQVIGLGRLSDKEPHSPAVNTIFEIGSVTKVFTGLILAQMTMDSDSDLGNTDAVQKALGNSLSIPKGLEHEITFMHLATHTSGLPRSPDNLDPKDPGNPFADYSVEHLRRFLSHHKLVWEPGTRFEYSNLGMGLLGHALSVQSGTSYESLLRSRICKPLGMSDTCVTLDKDHQSHRVQGHDADGQPVRDWDWDVLAGAGAVRSTAYDMLKFLAANLAPEKTPFGSAIALSQIIHFKSLDDEDAVGLGWRIRQHFAADDNPAVPLAQRFRNDGRVIWHGGETGGYSAFVGFWPEKRVAAVVLSNRVCIHLSSLGFSVVDLLGTGKAGAISLPTVVKVPSAALDQLIGTYRMLPSAAVQVTRRGDQLLMQITGQDACKCYPTSELSFFLRVVEAKVSFEKNKSGNITQLIIHQNGRDTPAIRVN
jgi:serine-type D-Ala-D-Ala carboxypeptidase/endopeptidase